jgi:Ca2+-binding RTX toxin-like protein
MPKSSSSIRSSRPPRSGASPLDLLRKARHRADERRGDQALRLAHRPDPAGETYAGMLRETGKADVLVGSGGKDQITGRGGADVLFGEAGDDELLGKPGATPSAEAPAATSAGAATAWTAKTAAARRR